MKMKELAETLRSEGYSDQWYSFSRERPPLEGFILEKVGARWIVFYFERGTSRDIANFEYETDACDFFYGTIRKEFGSSIGRTAH